MFRRLKIWHWNISRQGLSMAMDNSIIMSQENHTEPMRTTSIININIHDYPITVTSFTHIVIHGQLQRTQFDSQGIL